MNITVRSRTAHSSRRVSPATALLFVAALVALWKSAPAGAQSQPAVGPLGLYTREYNSWPAAVAALQTNTRAQGASLHVYVQDASMQRVACDSYWLTLDTEGARAFAIGTCDPQSRETTVRLVNRAELFASGSVVPVPRVIRIQATQLVVSSVQGGARVPSGSEVRCSLALRPYLSDLLHGTPLFLDPVNYELRLLRTDVTAQAQPGQWQLSATGVLAVDYEVLQRSTQRVVLRSRAEMECSAGAAPPNAGNTGTAPPGAVPAANAGAHAPLTESARGDVFEQLPLLMPDDSRAQFTLPQRLSQYATCASHSQHVMFEQAFRLVVPADGLISLTPDYAHGHTWITVRARHGGENERLVCWDIDEEDHLGKIALSAGEYWVIVQRETRRPANGTLALRVRTEPLARFLVTPLTPGVAVSPVVPEGVTHLHGYGRCGHGGDRQVVYSLEVTEPSLLRFNLQGEAALYIRRSLADIAGEIACFRINPRQPAAMQFFDPGHYIIVLDELRRDTSYTLLTALTPVTALRAPGGSIHGTTVQSLGQAVDRLEATCGGHGGGEQVIPLVLDHDARVRLSLRSGFNAAMYVLGRSRSQGRWEEATCRAASATAPQVDMNLHAGVYYVVVDGPANTSHAGANAGTFDLRAEVQSPDPVYVQSDDMGDIDPGKVMSGRLPAGLGRELQRYPIQTFWLTVGVPSRATVRLRSHFPAALVVTPSREVFENDRDPSGTESCRAMAAGSDGDPHGCNATARREGAQAVSVSQSLTPGRYRILVMSQDLQRAGSYELFVDLAAGP